MPKTQKQNLSTRTPGRTADAASGGQSKGQSKSQNKSREKPSDGPGSGHNDGFANHAIDKNTPSRGSSIQGPRQNAKGGPAGANQGGASRGGSRVEPSHQQRAAKKDRSSK